MPPGSPAAGTTPPSPRPGRTSARRTTGSGRPRTWRSSSRCCAARHPPRRSRRAPRRRPPRKRRPRSPTRISSGTGRGRETKPLSPGGERGGEGSAPVVVGTGAARIAGAARGTGRAGRAGGTSGTSGVVGVRVGGIAGHLVLDPVPGVAGGVAGLAPGLARGAPGGVPAVLQLGLHVLEAAAGAIAGAGLPAVLVGRLVLVVAAIGVHVRPGAVVLAPVGVLRRRVDTLGDAVAHQAAGHCAHRRTHQGSHRPAHRRADRSPRGRASRRADAAADWMYLVVALVTRVRLAREVASRFVVRHDELSSREWVSV